MLVEPTSVWRYVTSLFTRLDITAIGKEPRRTYIHNRITQSLACLFAKSGDKSVPLEATAGGELKVASTGAGLESYDYDAATAADDSAISVAFAAITSSIDLAVLTHPALVRFSADGSVWGEWFTVDAGGIYSKDLVVHTMEIKNAGAGNDHTYRVWGYA